MPIFLEYGIDRQKLLKMRHWEIRQIISNYYCHRAKNLLALSDAIALGSGSLTEESAKQIADNLRKVAKIEPEKTPVPTIDNASNNWLSGLATFASVY